MQCFNVDFLISITLLVSGNCLQFALATTWWEDTATICVATNIIQIVWQALWGQNLSLRLHPHGAGGHQWAQCACTFFRRLFSMKKRGLEVQIFLTFPNSLFFTVFLGDLEGAGTLCPPLLKLHLKAPHH